jgi:hypothetical protein
MSNHIRQVTIRVVRLTPTEAELAVAVPSAPDGEVRGRLMGPRCAYSTTIEVAYPLRDQQRSTVGPETVTARVIIPEPSWWDPQSPFYYEGPIEWWAGGQKRDQVKARCGLCHFQTGSDGFRMNGRPLRLKGLVRGTCSERHMRELRTRGYNLLVVPVEDATAHTWEIADRIGMLILGRMSEKDFRASELVNSLAEHPCCLGWVVRPTDGDPQWVTSLLTSLAYRDRPRHQLVGLEMKGGSGDPLPEGMQFVTCSEEVLERLSAWNCPKLVYGPPEAGRGHAGVIGSIVV